MKNLLKLQNQLYQRFTLSRMSVDKNLKYKSFDGDSINARKRLKHFHESAQTENNLKNSKNKQSKIKNVENNNDLQSCLYQNNAQTSKTNTDGIETIQNHRHFHKKIVVNKQSTPSGDISDEMIELNNNSDNIGANNDTTETSEKLNKKKLSITEGLKLFPGENKHEQWDSFLKMKVIERIKKRADPELVGAEIVKIWMQKYKSIIDEINKAQNELIKKFGIPQVDGNSMFENSLLSNEESNESLDTNEINTAKKLSTNQRTSKELMKTTIVVSPSTLNPPTIINTNTIDLTESDGEDEQSTNPSNFKELTIPTTKVVSPSTLNPPTITNTDCIDLTGSDEEHENVKLPTTILISKVFSKEPNSYTQPRTLLPKPISHAVNPIQLQSSTSNVTNPPRTPHQLLNCKVIQPQPNNALKILLPPARTVIYRFIPTIPPFSYHTKPGWTDMLLQKPNLYLSKIINPRDIKIFWCYIPSFSDSPFSRIVSFQIFMFPGYKNSNEWEFLKEVDAFPMNCTITRLDLNKEYYFIVRARDEYGRLGPFCIPLLVMKK